MDDNINDIQIAEHLNGGGAKAKKVCEQRLPDFYCYSNL
jgi:hypothetical protein